VEFVARTAPPGGGVGGDRGGAGRDDRRGAGGGGRRFDDRGECGGSDIFRFPLSGAILLTHVLVLLLRSVETK